MKLDIWLSSNKISQADLARAIGVSRVRAHRLVKGSKPDDDEAVSIASFTSGDVTPNDFYPAQVVNLMKRTTRKRAESKAIQT